MTDDDPRFDDVELDTGPDDRSEPDSPPPGGSRPSPAVWVILAVLLLVLGVGGWYLFLREAPGPVTEEVEAPAEVAESPEGEPAAEPAEEEIDLPPLPASDEAVRRIVGTLSEHPDLAAWLATEGLVQRFVLAVDNVAVGLSPRKQVPFMGPEEGFEAAELEGGEATIAPEAYDRYDRVAAVVASLDPEGTVATYERLRPLVEEASEELGYGPGGFDQRLERAILHLLRTPVPAEPPELRQEVLSWRYVDPRLEDLSDAQKQLLRMGPENQRRIQAKLRQIARELGIPESRIPAETVLTASPS